MTSSGLISNSSQMRNPLGLQCHLIAHLADDLGSVFANIHVLLKCGQTLVKALKVALTPGQDVFLDFRLQQLDRPTRARNSFSEAASDSLNWLKRSSSTRRPWAVNEYCWRVCPRSPGTSFLLTQPSFRKRRNRG